MQCIVASHRWTFRVIDSSCIIQGSWVDIQGLPQVVSYRLDIMIQVASHGHSGLPQVDIGYVEWTFLLHHTGQHGWILCCIIQGSMGRVTAMERDAKKVTPVEVRPQIYRFCQYTASHFLSSLHNNKKVVPLMSLLS